MKALFHVFEFIFLYEIFTASHLFAATAPGNRDRFVNLRKVDVGFLQNFLGSAAQLLAALDFSSDFINLIIPGPHHTLKILNQLLL